MPPQRTAALIAQDEVLTGEAVALDVQPVGFLLRAVGVAIDMAIGTALLIAALLVTVALVGNGSVPDSALGIVFVVGLVGILVVVPTAVETATRGRSVGKLAVGARVVRTDGGAAGFRQAFLRALAGVLELWMTFGALAAIVAAFSPRSQRIGDLLAGTYAERTRVAPLPPDAPGLPPQLVGWAAVADVARLPDRLSRRIAGFLGHADRVDPAARARIAAELAAEAAPFVSPMPSVDPETFLVGVAAMRRARELRALETEDRRTASLTAGATGAPRDFPTR